MRPAPLFSWAIVYIVSSGYTDWRLEPIERERAGVRPAQLAGGCDAQPAAAATGPARAHGIGALCHPAAAAVHRQPALEGPGRRGLGGVAGGGHESPVPHGPRPGPGRACPLAGRA